MYEIKNTYGNYVNAAVSSGAGKTKVGEQPEARSKAYGSMTEYTKTMQERYRTGTEKQLSVMDIFYRLNRPGKEIAKAADAALLRRYEAEKETETEQQELQMSDEGKEQKGIQESETRTDIIVKPDGSRVLVVTMSVGGIETTMSLEISKPTALQNESRNEQESSTEQSIKVASCPEDMGNVVREG